MATDPSESSQFWNNVSQLPLSLAKTFENGIDSLDRLTQAFENHIDSMEDRRHERLIEDKEEPAGSSEASEAITSFCYDFSGHFIPPSEDSLARFWSRLSLVYSCSLDPKPIAIAFVDALEWNDSDTEWEPRLRALHFLTYLREKGAVGDEILAAIAQRAGRQIRRLIRVPELKEYASKVDLELYGDLSVFDGDWTHKHKRNSVETINGDCLIWWDGSVSRLMPMGKGRICVSLSNSDRDGRDSKLQVAGELIDGEIVWENGNVWVRDSRPVYDGHMFEISIEQTADSKLGVSIVRGRWELTIKEFNEGLIKEWSRNNPDNPVLLGDQIIAVNGIEGNAGVLLKAIKDSKQLQLSMRRIPIDDVEFEIDIMKEEEGVNSKLGVDISKGETDLRIGQLKEGLISNWNRDNLARQVEPGDAICGVNGVKGTSDELLKAIVESKHLKLLIRQSYREFSATIEKGNWAKLGIDISGKTTDNARRSLTIGKVREGPVNDWNMANPEKEVRPGDRVVIVNGVDTSFDDMVARLQEDNPLELRIRRQVIVDGYP